MKKKTKSWEDIPKVCDTDFLPYMCDITGRLIMLCPKCKKEHKSGKSLEDIESQARQEAIKECINGLYKLNWIKILNEAIESRKTSWVKNPVIEWRNASDEILMAVIKSLKKKL